MPAARGAPRRSSAHIAATGRFVVPWIRVSARCVSQRCVPRRSRCARRSTGSTGRSTSRATAVKQWPVVGVHRGVQASAGAGRVELGAIGRREAGGSGRRQLASVSAKSGLQYQRLGCGGPDPRQLEPSGSKSLMNRALRRWWTTTAPLSNMVRTVVHSASATSRRHTLEVLPQVTSTICGGGACWLTSAAKSTSLVTTNAPAERAAMKMSMSDVRCRVEFSDGKALDVKRGSPPGCECRR